MLCFSFSLFPSLALNKSIFRMKWLFAIFLLSLTHRNSLQQNDARFIVNVAHYTLPDIDTAKIRCAASIITNRHVLTTANCVIVEPGKGVAIKAFIVEANGGSVNSKKVLINVGCVL